LAQPRPRLAADRVCGQVGLPPWAALAMAGGRIQAEQLLCD